MREVILYWIPIGFAEGNAGYVPDGGTTLSKETI